jgi:hypothetical protein
MDIPVRMWQRLWREFRPDDESEQAAELRELFLRTAFRMAAAFAVLFGAVCFALWWSGSAIRFGAARAADRAVASWQISGKVRSSQTGEGIPWASVEDDPGGRPPFFRTDADRSGIYQLLTFAEPHRVRVSSPGYRAESVEVGRAWFLWMPQGHEKKDIALVPLLLTPK